MKLTSIFVLQGQGITRILWKPRIMTSNSKVMSRAIRHELESARASGREFSPGKVIRGFQLLTGGLRLNDSEALKLFEVVSKTMKEETLKQEL